MGRFVVALALILVVTGRAASALERVDLEVVLLADASRSIDDGEIRLQRQGYAAAITHPDILAAIASGFHGRIAVVYVEWGGVDQQKVVAPWTIVDGRASAADFARILLETPRRAFGPNAIGNAIATAHGLIDGNRFEGSR